MGWETTKRPSISPQQKNGAQIRIDPFLLVISSYGVAFKERVGGEVQLCGNSAPLLDAAAPSPSFSSPIYQTLIGRVSAISDTVSHAI